MTRAYIVGTLDTKGEELLYIRDLLAAAGVAGLRRGRGHRQGVAGPPGST